MDTPKRCGAVPPADLKTRSGQNCIRFAGHAPEAGHRTFDLKWYDDETEAAD